MKVRQSFVSNSSSSSFCILGFWVDDSLEKKLIDAALAEAVHDEIEYWGCTKCDYAPKILFYKEKSKFCERCGGDMAIKTRLVERSISIWEVFESLDLRYYRTDDGSVAGIGINGKTIEETLEVKERLIKILEPIDPSVSISILGGTYYS